MDQKTFESALEFKAGDEGTFSAVFCTLETIDHDGDVIRKGAFRSGQKVLVEGWNHDLSRPPVGKGTIREQGNEAVVDGSFFLATETGREHYQIVKELGSTQEWSFTFKIAKASHGDFGGKRVRFLEALDTIGVSPVTRGAGVGTRTTDLKAAPKADHGHRDKLPIGMTPETAKAAIWRLVDPGTVLDEIDAELTDAEMADLQTRVDARGALPTNRDLLKAAVVAEHGPDHPPAWLETMVEVELSTLAREIARRKYAAFPDARAILLARAEAERWARQARR